MARKKRIVFENNIFDIIRLWAILQVMTGHCMSHLQVSLPRWITMFFSFPGVVVLFAISGFLVTASWDKQINKPSGKIEYLKRRAARIFPGLWVSIVVSTICILMIYDIKPGIKDGVIYLVTQFGGCNFYTGDWLRGYGVGAPNGSLWTIMTELQFYVVIMLIWKWLKQRNVVAWCSVIVGGLAVNAVVGLWGNTSQGVLWKLVSCSVLPYLYMFLIGAFIYRYKEKMFGCLERYGVLVLLILLCGFLLGERFVSMGHYYNVLSGMCLSVLAIVSAYMLNKRIRLPFDISYGIYLYHMVIVNILVHTGRIGNLFWFAFSIIGSVMCGFISWYCVEKKWLVRRG